MVVGCRSAARVLAQAQNSLYVCRSCKHRLTRAGVSVQQQRFASNEGVPPAEISKRRIRDGENPSGSQESTGRPGSLEERHARKKAQLDTTGTDMEVSTTKQSDEYVPAETWEGLKMVGHRGRKQWQNAPERSTDKFSTWLESTSTVASDRKQLISCLHQAIVECLTCNKTLLNPANIVYLESAQYNTNMINAFSSARIEASSSGTPGQIRFADEAQAAEIVEVLASVDKAINGVGLDTAEIESNASAAPEVIEAEAEAREFHNETKSTIRDETVAQHYNVQDESFLTLQLSVDDPTTFNILKRFSRLSGHRIPDPILNTALSSSKPLSFLVDQLYDQVVRPSPTKITDILATKLALNSQSNVMIFSRRETMVDKEKELGRWKVIEKELQDRGLPALGRPSQQVRLAR